MDLFRVFSAYGGHAGRGSAECILRWRSKEDACVRQHDLAQLSVLLQEKSGLLLDDGSLARWNRNFPGPDHHARGLAARRTLDRDRLAPECLEQLDQALQIIRLDREPPEE